MRRTMRMMAMAGAAALMASPALAQEPPGDADKGHVLAKTWCSGCHLVEANETTARDVVPSLAAVAAMKSTTVLSLQAFLQTPHDHMPDWRLTRKEIDDVVAYIMSLRQHASCCTLGERPGIEPLPYGLYADATTEIGR